MTPETAIKLGAIALIFLFFGAVFVLFVFIMVRGWRRARVVLDAALAEEYASLLASGEFLRQTGVGTHVRILTGHVDGVPVRVELLFGYKRGSVVSRTTIIAGDEAAASAPRWEATVAPSTTEGLVEVLKVHGGGAAAETVSHLGPAAAEVAEYLRRFGPTLIGRGGRLEWRTRDLGFAGGGAERVRRLAALARAIRGVMKDGEKP
jgi:hypothetical protein